ncbi:MAG: helix-turn-helix transcriptional regulator [Bacteroidota bacterium]
MNRTGFILAVESFLVRKGLVATLSRIPGTLVVKEFDTAPGLMEFMKSGRSEYLVISQTLFREATALFFSPGRLLERTILVVDTDTDPGHGNVRTSIGTWESKDTIMKKFTDILHSHGDQSAGAREFGLTPREKTILRLVSMGLTNKQIADQLFLSAHTVITHRKNISGKLGIKSVSGLTIYAIVNNIITIEEASSKHAE